MDELKAILEELGYNDTGLYEPGYYENMYLIELLETDIMNITASYAKETFAVALVFHQKEWEKFKHVKFEIMLRKDYYVQTKYIGAQTFKENIKLVRYEMTVLTKEE